MRTPPSRRDIFKVLGGLGLATVAGSLAGCDEAAAPDARPLPGDPTITDHPPPMTDATHLDNVQALMDVLLPAERDVDGQVLVPGAVEAGAEAVMEIENFIPLVQGQGFLPPVVTELFDGARAFDTALRQLVNADLDVLASLQRPFAAFRELPLELREAAVQAGFDDPVHRPTIEYVRVACFLAWLGAVQTDVGLQAIGFPPFEDLAGGVAVRGYPRLRSGELVDATTQDLATLGDDLDDYTYNRAPASTSDDDLSGVVDAVGDLL